MTFFIWVRNWRDVSHGNRESPGVKARKWGLRCWRPRCCEPRSAGWREDDRYSAETLLHRASAVRKLSGCHDSIPTGYELIWTCDNTTVSFCRKEKPPHSHLGRVTETECTIRSSIYKVCPDVLCEQFKIRLYVQLDDVCVSYSTEKWTRTVKNGVNGSGETLTVMLKEPRLTFSESGKIELRAYRSTAMIIKSLQVCPPPPPPWARLFGPDPAPKCQWWWVPSTARWRRRAD